MYVWLYACMYVCMILFEDETNTIRHPICIQGSYQEHIAHKSTDDTLFTCMDQDCKNPYPLGWHMPF